MKNLLRAGAVALAFLLCGPVLAASPTASCASYDAVGNCLPGIVLWDPTARAPYAASGGTGGGNAAAGTTGSSVPNSASYTGYVGADGLLHGWLGDNAGHPGVSIFGTPTVTVGNVSIPVTGTFWQSVQPISISGVTPDANANVPVANRGSIFWNGATGSGSALTGSATFTGTTRDSGYASGTYHQFSYFNAFFLTDQSGTALIECSNDSTTYYTCATAALTAATPLILQVPVLTRYHRAKVVNGSTAETYLWVNSGYTAG
jgi:hypothetical protein